jgi:hypothetical protein
LTKASGFDIIVIRNTITRRADFSKTAENSDRTAGSAAVILFAVALSAQDFRGECDIDG